MYNQTTLQAMEKNPLIRYLPHNNGLFSIGQGASKKTPGDPTTSAVYVHYLTPASKDEATKWIEKRTDITKLEVIYLNDYRDNRTAGLAFEEYYSTLSQNFPLVTKLPFRDPYYTISYRSDNEKDFSLVVYTPSPRYRYAAINQIRTFGYDPSDYKIEFVDYSNPLGN